MEAALPWSAQASPCSGFSCRGAQALGPWALAAAVLRLSSYGTTHGLSCSAACGYLPGPGIKPTSPALAGGFFTSRPPGTLPGSSSWTMAFKNHDLRNFLVDQWLGFHVSIARSTGSIPAQGTKTLHAA